MALITKFVAYLIGSLNIAFVIFGVGYFTWTIRSHGWSGPWTFVEIGGFLVFASTGLVLSLASAIAGVRLIQRQYSAVRNLVKIYLAELLYSLLIGVTWYVAPDSTTGRSMVVGLWGIAQGFLAPQISVLYPLLGILCMLGLLVTKHTRGASLYWEKNPI